MMTKKFILPVLTASVFAFSAQAATAQDMDMDVDGQHEYTYLALDAHTVDFGGSDAVTSGDDYGALSLALGARANRHFGFEVGYFRTEEQSNPAGTVDFYAHGVTADLIGYLPLTDDEDFELFANAGIAMTRYETETGTAEDSDNEASFRFGGGAQYHISDDWAARARFTHTEASENGIDDYQSISVGIAYKF